MVFLCIAERLRERYIAKELAARLVAFLHRQRLVVDDPTYSSETAHIALLRTLWHDFEF